MKAILKYSLLIIAVCLLVVGGYLLYHYVPDQPLNGLAKRWAQAPSQFMDINGMSVHIRDQGPKDDPEAIVLIHGTSASLHTWDAWSAALMDQRRVIRFDLPGFGLTGPEPNQNYAIEHYAKFVVAVLDKLNIRSGVLVGNSLGGYIAWATSVLHPARVSKLVLVDASGYPYAAKSVPLAFQLAQMPIIKYVIKNVLPRSLVENSLRNVYGNPELVTPNLVGRYFDLATREGNRAALSQRFKQTIPGPLIQRLGEIKVPTLILWGEKDHLIPMVFAEQFHSDIENSQLVTFQHLGHVPHEEGPDETVAAFKAFIEDE